MFSAAPWNNSAGPVKGLKTIGLQPGGINGGLKPLQAAPTFGAPAQAPAVAFNPNQMSTPPMRPATVQQQLARNQPPQNQVAQPQAGQNQPRANGSIPMGDKASCPVCHSFGGKR